MSLPETIRQILAKAIAEAKPATPEEAQKLNEILATLQSLVPTVEVAPTQDTIEKEALNPPQPPSPPRVWAEKQQLAGFIEAGARGIKDNVGYADVLGALGKAIQGMPSVNLSGWISMEMSMPTTSARLAIAREIYMSPFKYGQDPLIRRYFNYLYQNQLPAASDMVRIYREDAWLPEHQAEIPEQYTGDMKELGFSPLWSARLWGSTWTHVGPSELFEMIHKQIISVDTAREGLKHLNYEPWWRERLLENMYTPLPRLYLRRALAYGILNPDQARTRYTVLGFHPADAGIMVQLDQRAALATYFTQIETQARALFKQGLMSEDEFKGWLQKSGLPAEAVQLAVDAENLAYRLDYTQDLITMARQAYVKDVYTADELMDRLLAYGMQPERAAAIVALEQLKKLPKPKVAG
jgi:hypothetical protein